MKQAMFRKDFHICHKLVENLTIKRQSPDDMSRKGSKININLSKIGSVAKLGSRRSSTTLRGVNSSFDNRTSNPRLAGIHSQSNPNIAMRSRDLAEAGIGLRNYTNEANLPDMD
jgi:hypothetical protein